MLAEVPERATSSEFERNPRLWFLFLGLGWNSLIFPEEAYGSQISSSDAPVSIIAGRLGGGQGVGLWTVHHSCAFPKPQDGKRRLSVTFGFSADAETSGFDEE